MDANFYLNRPHQAQIIRNLSRMNVAAQVIDYIFSGEVGEEEDRPLIEAVDQAQHVYPVMVFKSLQKHPIESQVYLQPGEQTYLNQTRWPAVSTGNTEAMYSGVEPGITFPALSSVSRGLGFLNIVPDRDGIVRRMPLVVRYGGTFYPSLAFRAVCDYLGVSPENIMVNPGQSIVLSNVKAAENEASQNLEIPIDRHGNLLLNFSESSGNAGHYSSSEIFQATEGTPEFDTIKAALTEKFIILSEAFGKRRLVDLFKNSYPSAQILIDTILNQINVHISDQSQFDDITILALRRKT